jgi:hypothetical protein
MTMLPVLPRLTERAFEREVVQYATLMRWRCWRDKASNARRTCEHCGEPLHPIRNPAGWPDLVLVRRPRVIFVELKSDRGKLTPDQMALLTELRECGQEVYVWRPEDWERIERTLR